MKEHSEPWLVKIQKDRKLFNNTVWVIIEKHLKV